MVGRRPPGHIDAADPGWAPVSRASDPFRRPRFGPASAVRLGASLALSAICPATVWAQEVAGPMSEPARPRLELTRWREDWSPLADPALRTEPLDRLKHLPLSEDPGDYLSLGANVRERFEAQEGALFGTAGERSDGRLLSRLQVHADLRVRDRFAAFVQLEDVRAAGLREPGPADINHLDLAQAFVSLSGQVGALRYGVRIGRQEIGFDLERFVSIREGPNVRQRYDAIWGEIDGEAWSLRGFVSRPVRYGSGSFDDGSDGDLLFHGLRLERRAIGPGDLSVYFAHYERAAARYGPIAGRERREILDLRYFKATGRLQLDLEAMAQWGAVGGRRARGWALGTRARYAISEAGWRPKAGLQLDLASGDGDPADGVVETFNPLFPNGLYFTQAGYTGYANLLHLKPSLALSPSVGVDVLAAVGVQWRATTADAVYVQPSIPVPGTAGSPGRHSGTYGQLRVDWQVGHHVRTSVELVRFMIGDVIRRAGGRDVDYVGVEVAFAW